MERRLCKTVWWWTKLFLRVTFMSNIYALTVSADKQNEILEMLQSSTFQCCLSHSFIYLEERTILEV